MQLHHVLTSFCSTLGAVLCITRDADGKSLAVGIGRLSVWVVDAWFSEGCRAGRADALCSLATASHGYYEDSKRTEYHMRGCEWYGVSCRVPPSD